MQGSKSNTLRRDQFKALGMEERIGVRARQEGKLIRRWVDQIWFEMHRTNLSQETSSRENKRHNGFCTIQDATEQGHDYRVF